MHKPRWFLPILAALLLGVLQVHAESPASLAGPYDIWEDFEGGTVCPLTLEDEPAIGGSALSGDDDCMQVFNFAGDPYAWFPDGEGRLVIIDATRRVLVRFDALQDGTFYAIRSDAGLENLNLTPQ